MDEIYRIGDDVYRIGRFVALSKPPSLPPFSDPLPSRLTKDIAGPLLDLLDLGTRASPIGPPVKLKL